MTARTLEHPIFTLEFVQAVNDYQCGGDSQKKAEKLIPFCAGLPPKFKSCTDICYRQEAHDQRRVWNLIAERNLPMGYSSWTTDLAFAKVFKGGVTPNGQGVILTLTPPAGSVILNLAELYRDQDFLDYLNDHKGEIRRYGDGIGRYLGQQSEVILDLPTGTVGSIHCLGGFIGDVAAIAREALQRDPTTAELEDLSQRLRDAGIAPGSDWWLSYEGSLNVWRWIQPHLPRLIERKKLQDQARAERDNH